MLAPFAAIAQMTADNPTALLSQGADQRAALRIHEAIYQAVGFGNTYLIATSAGNVIVDTSLPAPAQRHRKLLQQVSAAPVRYIILTHGHGDHTGGIPLWKQPGTQIIAQRNHVEFAHYQKRLEGFFAFRNAAQFAFPRPAERPWPGNYGAAIQPSILFDDTYEFTLGGVKFSSSTHPERLLITSRYGFRNTEPPSPATITTNRFPISIPCAAPHPAGRSTTSLL